MAEMEQKRARPSALTLADAHAREGRPIGGSTARVRAFKPDETSRK